MHLNEVQFHDAIPIDGYGPNFFRVGGQVHHGAVLVSAAGVSAWNGLNDVDPLLALSETIDVLFVGMGPEIAHLPPELRTTLEEAGLGIEVMSSPSAARTYNVLLSEGRRIAAALLPVGD